MCPLTQTLSRRNDVDMDGEPARGLFFGVGVDRYSSAHLPDLPGSADEVERIAGVVGDHFGVCLYLGRAYAGAGIGRYAAKAETRPT